MTGGSRADRPVLGLVEKRCPSCHREMGQCGWFEDGSFGWHCGHCGEVVEKPLPQQGRSPERQARDVRIGWWILAGFALAVVAGVVLTAVGVIQVVAR